MTDEPAYYLDIDGVEEKPRSAPHKRPWIGIMFDCCRVYARVHRNRRGTAYVGQCPHCLRKFRIRIGRGGTDVRFFHAK